MPQDPMVKPDKKPHPSCNYCNNPSTTLTKIGNDRIRFLLCDGCDFKFDDSSVIQFYVEQVEMASTAEESKQIQHLLNVVKRVLTET